MYQQQQYYYYYCYDDAYVYHYQYCQHLYCHCWQQQFHVYYYHCLYQEQQQQQQQRQQQCYHCYHHYHYHYRSGSVLRRAATPSGAILQYGHLCRTLCFTTDIMQSSNLRRAIAAVLLVIASIRYTAIFHTKNCQTKNL